jgi:hypothetical protein
VRRPLVKLSEIAESFRSTRLSGKVQTDMKLFLRDVRFQVLTSVSMKFRVFWDEVPCSHVKVDRRFGGAYCLLHEDDEDGGSTRL